jgi:integrase
MVKGQIIPLTRDEMADLLKAAMDDEFWYMFYNVAKKTGRRLGEYYDVKVKDIDIERRIMMTKVLKRRKMVEKEAILDEQLMFLIQNYIRRNGLKLEDYLFRKVGYRQIQNKVKFYAKKAGIGHNVSFHNFRHYLITELFKAGWSYDRISKLTGHSSAGTLALYDHTVASDIAAEARTAIVNI